MNTSPGFVGERLTEARRARGISATDLSGLVGVSSQSLSKYENGHQAPRLEVLDAIAAALNMPRAFFMRPPRPVDDHPVFWRARLSAPPVMRDRAAVRLEWMKDVVDYIAGFFDFPELSLPEISPPDVERLDVSDLEAIAAEVREKWGVRPGPMPDVVEKLEASGVPVARIHVGAEKLDAFSQWSPHSGIPFIMLSRDKASAVRQRFDALHEMAHMILHRFVPAKRMNDRAYYNMLEKQADRLASFILLPAKEFSDELYAPSLDSFLSMKERWGASIGAMIMRCVSLDILDEDGARRLWINYNRRGWRGNEPLDGKMEKERPHMLKRSFELLISENVQSPAEIMAALPYPAIDLEEIADIEPGTLAPKLETRAEPTLKAEYRNEANVVSMFDRRR